MTSSTISGPPFPKPPPPPSRCQLDVAASPWAQHCQRLERVCLDQSTIILYDDQYQELDGKVAGALPQLRMSSTKVFAWPWRGREADATAAALAGLNATTSMAGEGDFADEHGSISSQGQHQERRRAYEVQVRPMVWRRQLAACCARSPLPPATCRWCPPAALCQDVHCIAVSSSAICCPAPLPGLPLHATPPPPTTHPQHHAPPAGGLPPAPGAATAAPRHGARACGLSAGPRLLLVHSACHTGRNLAAQLLACHG